MKILKWAGVLLLLLGTISFIAIIIYDYRENKWYAQVKIPQPRYQQDTVTVLCIVGTVHIPTKNYNADSLFEIINHFNPDIILTETDTNSYRNILKEYQRSKVPIFAKIGRTFGFRRHVEENETRAVRKYRGLYPSIVIRPFDYEGRDQFHAEHNILSGPDTVMKIIQSLFDKNELSPHHRYIWKAWKSINDELDHYYEQTSLLINHAGLYGITERRQELQYQGINQIVQEDSRLEKYRSFYHVNTDFWDTRNKSMADHILHFTQLNPKKRVMVLTGFMHKYYLLNELYNKQEEWKFRLKEYYGE